MTGITLFSQFKIYPFQTYRGTVYYRKFVLHLLKMKHVLKQIQYRFAVIFDTLGISFVWYESKKNKHLNPSTGGQDVNIVY